MMNFENEITEGADKLIDRFHGVSDAIKFAESKINALIDKGIKYKFDRSIDDESTRYWVLVYDELIERSNLEL